MFENKRIMVVAAHPDDELLGLGATLHKIIREQHATVHVVILGEGITSRSDTRDPEQWKQQLEQHHRNIEAARKCIGYQSVKTYNFADNRFDSHDLLDIVKVVEHEKEQFQPDIIFTHNATDLNIDHQRTFQAVMTATRPMEDEGVKTVICFETPSATEWQATNVQPQFAPNLYVAVDKEDIEAKIQAMAAYEFESRAFPHPRSAEALCILAQYRAVQVGARYAEAFQIVRQILK